MGLSPSVSAVHHRHMVTLAGAAVARAAACCQGPMRD